MDLQEVMLNEIIQTEKRQIPYYFTYTQKLKHKTNEQTTKKQTHKYRELVVAKGEEGGEMGKRERD